MVINKYLAELMGTLILVGLGSMGILAVGGATGAAEILAIGFAFGLALLAGIWAVGHVSGAHFNPIVSLSQAVAGELRWASVARYVPAQLGGAIVGVVVAHGMFGERLIAASLHERSGFPQLFAELVATFGLMNCMVS